MIRVACGCGRTFGVPDAQAGLSGRCPGCGGALVVPRPRPSARAPTAAAAPPPATPTPTALATPPAELLRFAQRASDGPPAASAPDSAPPDGDDERACPRCAERIKAQALACRFCGHELAPAEGAKRHSERVSRASRVLMSRAREAGASAWQALARLALDPLEGQAAALASLGEARTLQAGGTFCALWLLGASLLALRSLSAIAPAGRSVGADGHITILLGAAIPPVALALGFLGVGLTFGRKTSLARVVFSTGVSLLPLSACLVLAWLVGVGNAELVVLAGFFAVSSAVLLLHATLVQVHGVSSRAAFLLTPALLLLSSYIAKVLVLALIERMPPGR